MSLTFDRLLDGATAGRAFRRSSILETPGGSRRCRASSDRLRAAGGQPRRRRTSHVSFQFELPNGFLGEAVGVLEYYDEGAATFVVRRKDGELARVPLRGVRFGKVVPG
jgi:hypothetical protein